MSNKQLSDDERLRLYEIQAGEVEAKVSLAELEMAHQHARSMLLSAIAQAVEDKETAFAEVVRSHGLDPLQWRPNIAEGVLEPHVSEAPIVAVEVNPFREDGDMDRRRGNAVRVSPIGEEDE